jgi:hypothetical protein
MENIEEVKRKKAKEESSKDNDVSPESMESKIINSWHLKLKMKKVKMESFLNFSLIP